MTFNSNELFETNIAGKKEELGDGVAVAESTD